MVRSLERKDVGDEREDAGDEYRRGDVCDECGLEDGLDCPASAKSLRRPMLIVGICFALDEWRTRSAKED